MQRRGVHRAVLRSRCRFYRLRVARSRATSYAFGDVFGTKSSLHRTFRDAKLFYGIFSGLVACAAAIVLIPGAPLGVVTEAVQALAGVLLPSATSCCCCATTAPCSDPGATARG